MQLHIFKNLKIIPLPLTGIFVHSIFLKIFGYPSFLIVELMRQGKSPQEAREEAIGRIVSKNKDFKDFQVGYIAVNKKGETGYFSIHEGFSVTKHSEKENINIPSKFFNKA